MSKPIGVAILRETTVSDPPSEPGDGSSVIDPQRLAALRGLGPSDGRGLLPKLTELFLRDSPVLLLAMRRAVAIGDEVGLRETAHQLKGAAASMGAVEVAALCQQIEKDASPADQPLDRLGVAVQRAAELLRHAVAGLPT